jgi:ketosteroid isomerase-like protein
MQDIKDVVGEFDRALEKRDVQAALAFFADDAEWTVAFGTFSGKDGIRRLLEWEMRTIPKATYRPACGLWRGLSTAIPDWCG